MDKKRTINKPKVVSIPHGPNSSKKLKFSLGLIIWVFAFILYAQSIPYNYTMDDHPAIDQNTITNQGIAGIPKLLTTDYWYGYIGDIRGPVYRPTSLILFAIVWQFSPDSPHVYHFLNVLFYALTCWVLFHVLCTLFKKQSLLFPFVCSLLYAAHPLHTEVVNNIKSMDEILCFLFGITSVWFILKYLSSVSFLSLIIGGISFFLSLISKETGITFLAIIPLIVFVFTDSSLKKIATISLVLVSLSGIYFLIRLQVLSGIKMTVNDSVLNNTLIAAPDFLSRQATAFYILLRYLLLLVFPHPLSCDYNFSQIKIQKLNDFPAIIGVLVNVALVIYAFLNLRKKSIVSFGILFYFIALSPVSNVFFLNGSTMAERFMYTPSFGFCIILTYFIIKLTKGENIKRRFNNLSQFFATNKISLFFMAAILVLYSIKTCSRNMDWKDNFTIFNHDAEISENSATVHYNKAFELINTLYKNEKNQQSRTNYNEVAIVELNKAISIFPNYFEYYFKLSNCYFIKEDYQNALLNYQKAMRLNPKLTSKVFRDFAFIYDKTNQFDKELIVLDSAIKYSPDSADIYNDKGCVLFSLHKYNEAIDEFQKAINLYPKYAAAFKNMGSCFINLGQYEKALECLNKSSELDSSDAETFKYMGMIYQVSGNNEKAKEYFERSNRMRPGQ